jgi:hypothetical protein
VSGSDKRLKLSADQRATYSFAGLLLTTEIEYSKWRVGDPSFPETRQWASGVANGLIENFDENALWKEFLAARAE